MFGKNLKSILEGKLLLFLSSSYLWGQILEKFIKQKIRSVRTYLDVKVEAPLSLHIILQMFTKNNSWEKQNNVFFYFSKFGTMKIKETV